MGDFHRCVEIILSEEGGLGNHPRDPGKLTKYGISQRAYPNLDIAALTREQAISLYSNDYWQPIHGDDLPAGLDLPMLDTAINQGAKAAVLLLQEALNVRVDGLIGGMTLNGASQQMPEIITRLCALRAWRYEIDRNEDVFGKGWFRRLFRIHTLALDWSRP